MESLSQEDQILLRQENQQTVWLQPWGGDGLRVQTTPGRRTSLPPARAARTRRKDKGHTRAWATDGRPSQWIDLRKDLERTEGMCSGGTEWTDAEKRTPHPGREWRSVKPPLERVQVFLKQGSDSFAVFRERSDHGGF